MAYLPEACSGCQDYPGARFASGNLGGGAPSGREIPAVTSLHTSLRHPIPPYLSLFLYVSWVPLRENTMQFSIP